MTGHTRQTPTEPVSRGFSRVGGYTIVAIIVALFLIALMINPVLP